MRLPLDWVPSDLEFSSTPVAWVGLALVGMPCLILAGWPFVSVDYADAFMNWATGYPLAEYGAELPRLTLLTLSWWFPPLLGAMVCGALGGALVYPAHRVRLRTGGLALAFLLGVAGVTLCLIGSSLPAIRVAAW